MLKNSSFLHMSRLNYIYVLLLLQELKALERGEHDHTSVALVSVMRD